MLPDHEAADEEVRLHAALAWLRANPGWLLILDNLDTPAALAEANRLMGRLAGGHVVLTSRLDGFERHVEPLELDVLTLDAAASFLLEATGARRRKAADDEALARELAEELGRLALALEQAAATIDRQRYGFRHYLEAWRGNRDVDRRDPGRDMPCRETAFECRGGAAAEPRRRRETRTTPRKWRRDANGVKEFPHPEEGRPAAVSKDVQH
jgi:hypothetical protein